MYDNFQSSAKRRRFIKDHIPWSADVISTQNKHNNSNYPLVPGQAFQINMYIESLGVKNIIVRECCPLAKRGVCTVYLCTREVAGAVRWCLNPGAKV